MMCVVLKGERRCGGGVGVKMKCVFVCVNDDDDGDVWCVYDVYVLFDCDLGKDLSEVLFVVLEVV